VYGIVTREARLLRSVQSRWRGLARGGGKEYNRAEEIESGDYLTHWCFPFGFFLPTKRNNDFRNGIPALNQYGNEIMTIDDFWRETIERISTAFGSLVYAASLRDENKGTYQHYGMEQYATPAEGHQFLAQAHRQLFYTWLNMDLEDQVDDLTFYLRDLSSDPGGVLETWRKIEPFVLYIPAAAGAGDRELFLTDLRLIVDLLTPVEQLRPEAAT
jgi:hypothetical protein